MDTKLERNLENKLRKKQERENLAAVKARINELTEQYDELIAEGFNALALSVKYEIMELMFNFETEEYDIQN